MIGEIAVLVTALAGFIGTVLTFVVNRQRKAAQDADALEDERNSLRQYVEALLRHVHALRRLLAEHGIEAPPVPDEPKDPR